MLELQDVSFSYLEKVVVKNISFAIPKGQNTAIIGESGCGKSTLLKLIYGLYDLDSGTIFYDKKPILGPKYNLVPGADYIKYLAQDFDLMPYITVAENVGKYLSNIYKDKKEARVQELLQMVEMTEYAHVKPKYLSGGQQQRVALARVLALEPEVLLLDEPFSQIDSFRKNSLRRNLFQYLKKKQITCIIATHDSTDALSFSDKTIVLRNGEIVSKGVSKTLFENPPSRYVASLFGEVNAIPNHLLQLTGNRNARVLVYSHQLKVVATSPFQVVVADSYFRGNQHLITAFYGEELFFFENKTAIDSGNTVFLGLDVSR
ncbi:ABC transporter ATP-binding protein [Flavobacterium restrictum]|uniref:ABC transporter ATP-binding protein n=1 Tax=Flavobacterium restrictum TaxID=2594428 RepID=A0A553E2G3_9FLAO|nr:ABC transporter ATP-binding protein [Flavobacterium restrictum]TRX39219.1 ABC transporter ATP-binding protein [Flavobacterium restrictum]